MKALINPVAILSVCLLQACSMSPERSSEQGIVAASLDNPTSIKPQPFVIRGEVVVGHEVRSLTPCGSLQQLWLDMPVELTQQAIKLAPSSYQTMYGEMVGYLATPSQTGYNGDYSARFIVQSINVLSAENPKRCERPTSPTTAFGTEPFWSMKYTPQGFLFHAMGNEELNSPITNRERSATRRYYAFKAGELTLEQALCSDGMSNSLYGWQSALSINGETYRGCAMLGNSDPTAVWAGQYFASSTQSNGFSVSLALENDHTATTRYTYNNGEPAIVERGYWQQLNSQQVQVVMTRHQQQYLVSERIFTRNDNHIIAEKEKIGNVVYPLSNGGLVLFSEVKSAQ